MKRPVIKAIVRLLVGIFVAVGIFAITNRIVVDHAIATCGPEAFEHDAGANFAVAFEAFSIGLPLAIVAFLSAWFLSGRILRHSSN